MPISEEKFRAALSDKHIPVLILDNKWHKLFKRSGTTPQIEALEKELTALLKRQGKLNSEIKGIKKLKGELMQGEVITLKVLPKHRRLIRFTQSGEIRNIADYLVISIDGIRFVTH